MSIKKGGTQRGLYVKYCIHVVSVPFRKALSPSRALALTDSDLMKIVDGQGKTMLKRLGRTRIWKPSRFLEPTFLGAVS